MKRTIGLLVSLVFLTSFFAAHVQASFTDTGGHWSEMYIENLVAQGVVSGYENGNFGPDDAVTRGQMAKIVVLAFELEADGTSLTDYVNAAVVQGILTGEYSPDEALTRAEAAKMLVLAADLSGSGSLLFTDVFLEDWFYEYVLAAYSNGLVNGYGDGRFGPNDTVTRGQVAKMTVLAQGQDMENNPFTEASFYVDPDSNAYQQIEEWAESRPDDAADLEALASQPTAKWFGDWSGDIETAVDEYVMTVNGEGNLPVLVAYNIPGRDCGSYSAGGSADADNYRTWIQGFADGVGERNAVVVLEPDALSLDCLYENSVGLLAEAVSILKSNVHISVYIDAGHSNWVPSADMATRLVDANVETADGFALNVSNFYTTEENIIYGEEVSALIEDKHFIIDTGRNGNGWNGEWCNPSERSLGENPTTETGNSLVDAFLWVKPPGESDGTCNGGPSAGAWWAEYALGLVQN